MTGMEANFISEKPTFRSKEEITAIIERWRASGKNKKIFCQENNLTYQTFIGWTAPKKKAKEKFPAFIPVRVSKPSPDFFAEINLPGGSKIIFQNEVRAEYLRMILR
jgi:hypothetical protein